MWWLLKLFVVTGILFSSRAVAQKDSSYFLQIHYKAKDSLFDKAGLAYQPKFASKTSLENYITKYLEKLHQQGFVAASVDAAATRDDTLFLDIYLGKQLSFTSISPVGFEEEALQFAGFRQEEIAQRPINVLELEILQRKLINYYADRGYPFAQVSIDSVALIGNTLQANLVLNKNYEYLLDSVHINGNAKLKEDFIYRYLGLKKRMPYNKDAMGRADGKLSRLPFINVSSPSDITMLGTGATLNLYLDRKKNNILNFLVGLMPSPDQTKKFILTGDVDIQLNNSFGNAESIVFKWQQLQPRSPRLHLSFDQAYVFRSAFGLNLLFDMLKKDSSYLLLTARTGSNYRLSDKENGKLFFEFQNISVLNDAVDTNEVKRTGQLPSIIDTRSSAVGLQYYRNSTNGTLSPGKGSTYGLTMVTGLKKLKRNTDVLKIKDPQFDAEKIYSAVKPLTYLLRLNLEAAKYLPISKYVVFKAGLQSGWYSSSSIFTNDLFQIGGYNIMRGFNEQSIYASLYNVVTGEFRLLIDADSYLFAFADGGLIQRKERNFNTRQKLFSGGAGMMVKTKSGVVNLSFAVGKTIGQPLKLSNASKIHFGYINYF